MMRKVLVGFVGFIGLLIVFAGCIKREEWEIIRYRAPNWTSDGRIVFMRDHYIQKWEDWTKGEHYTEMFIMKRDGIGFKNLGEGSWPDLSPDGKKIVYQKPNQGLWIKNIDGSGDRRLVTEGIYPAWSPEGEKISYTNNKLYVVDSAGNLLFSDTIVIDSPDWGPLDSNAISGNHWPSGKSIIIYFDSLNQLIRVDTLVFISGWRAGLKWSSQGDLFIGYDKDGYFVIKRDGTNKWYLKP